MILVLVGAVETAHETGLFCRQDLGPSMVTTEASLGDGCEVMILFAVGFLDAVDAVMMTLVALPDLGFGIWFLCLTR